MTDQNKMELTLDNLDKILKKLNSDTQLLCRKRKLDDLSQEMPALEVAKLNSSIGYSLNCLYKSRQTS